MQLPESIRIKHSHHELLTVQEVLLKFVGLHPEKGDLVGIITSANLIVSYRRVSKRLITPRKAYTVSYPLAEATAIVLAWGTGSMLNTYQEEVMRGMCNMIYKELS